MDAHAADRAEQILLSLLDLPPDRQDSVLRETCGRDDDLRAQVEHLLSEQRRAADYFDEFAASLFGQTRTAGSAGDDPYQVIGRSIGDYDVVELVGKGGMGVVYRAIDRRLRRSVAVKFLPPDMAGDPDAVKRFTQEAKAASALDHPNICPVYQIAEHDDLLYMVMAFCDGETLKQRILRGPLAISEALEIARQIAAGLAHAHRHGIIHRDVKPGNVLISPDGVVRLVDFGLAKLADRTQLTRTGATIGTVAYMSPEQAMGAPVDADSDVWSLGVVLYEMLTGVRPFTGERDHAVLYGILHRPHKPASAARPEVTPDLSMLVDRCLEKDASARFPDGDAVLRQLTTLAATRAPEARRVSVRPAWRRSAIAAVVTLLLTLAIVAERRSDSGASADDAGAAIPRLAVLPFEVDAADSETHLVYEGLAESLGRRLALLRENQAPRLRVIQASEVRAQRVSTLREARRILGANLAARVSLTSLPDGLRVNLALEDTQTAREVAIDSFSMSTNNLFDLHERLAERMAELLGLPNAPAQAGLLSAFDTGSDDALQHYLKGLALLDRPDRESGMQKAIDHFETAIAEDPTFARAYDGSCEALWRMYDHSGERIYANAALDNCRRALEIDPMLASAHVTRALVLNGTDQNELALSAIARALDLDPSDAEAFRVRGRILEALGQTNQAERAYLQAIALDRMSWRGYSSLGNLYLRSARYDEALSAFEQITTVAPDFVWGYLNLGAAQFSLGRIADARSTWQNARTLRDDYDIISNLATALFFERKFSEAARAYEEARRKDERDYVLWGNLASAYQWTPNLRIRARAAYERAVEIAKNRLAVTPDNPELLLHLASYQAQLGDTATALTLVQRAIRIDSTTVNVMFAVADVYEQTGDRREALHWLGKALQNGYPSFLVEENVWFDELRKDPRYIKMTADPARE